MYKFYDYTEQNFDCLLDAKKLRNNLTEDSKPQSILEDEEFQKDTKKALLESSLRETSITDPQFDELLETYIDVLYGEVDEDKKDEIKEKVKFEIKNAEPIQEDKKPKYVADKYISRNVLTLSNAIKVKK